MIRLKMPLFFNRGTVTPEQLFPLTEKVILGSAVCIMEGAAASLAFTLPKGLGFYYGGCLMLFAMCLVMFNFRTSKRGAELFEIYFYELLVWGGATAVVLAGGKSTLFWYICNALFFLRLIRVYAWQGTTTHDEGWGVFGFSSYFYNKKHPTTKTTNGKAKMALALLMAIGLAAIATVLVKPLSDQEREAVPWAFAIIYVTLNGPILLRSLGAFIQKFLASTTREAADAVEKAKMRQTIEALQTTHNLADERAALLLAAFFNTHEKKRDHMLEMAQLLAAHYPANPKPPA